MPRYDYQCTECNHLFELKQGFDAETVTDCPKCGKIAERQISLVPVIFKGSGWYVNDYGRKKSTLGDSSSSNGSDGGSDGDGFVSSQERPTAELRSELRTLGEQAAMPATKSAPPRADVVTP